MAFPSRNQGPPVGERDYSKLQTTRDQEGLPKGTVGTLGPSDRARPACQSLFREFWVRPRGGGKWSGGPHPQRPHPNNGLVPARQFRATGRDQTRRAPDAGRNRDSGPRALQQVAGAHVGPRPQRAKGTHPGCGDSGGGAWHRKPGKSLGSGGCPRPTHRVHYVASTVSVTRTRTGTQAHPGAKVTCTLGTCPCLSAQNQELRPRAEAAFWSCGTSATSPSPAPLKMCC